MTRLDNGIDLSVGGSDRKAFLIVLSLLIAGFFIGQFVSAMLTILMAVMGGAGLDTLSDPELLLSSIGKTQMLIAQSFYTLVFTFLTPWFYLKVIAKKSIGDLYTTKKVPAGPLIFVIFGTVAFMLFNVFLIEWNAGMSLPEWMSGVEEWMKDLEEQLAETTEMLVTFNSFFDFAFAFFVIAILPGIGEEIMFRGVLQNSLHRWSKNAHLAVWVSGFIFAAFHLQFYGLAPRMMLGVLFGYLYVWSGNLWYPIIAHIINNGVSLLLSYLYQLGYINVNPDSEEAASLGWSIGGLVICIILLYAFRNYYLKQKQVHE